MTCLSLLMEGGPLVSMPLQLDRIFIRDMMVSCHVGVYPHEKETPQQVRVNIDLGVVVFSCRRQVAGRCCVLRDTAECGMCFDAEPTFLFG